MASIMRAKTKTTKVELIGRLIGFMILMGVATHWFANKYDNSSAVNTHQRSVIEGMKSTITDKSPPPASNDTSVKVSGDSAVINEVDVADHKEWLKDMGYSTKEEKDNYAYYDEKTILALAKNNDLLAIKALAKKAIDNHDFEAAKKYYWHAAAVGATPALDQLALLVEPTPYDKEQGMPYVRSKFFDELAICKVIEMRGDIKMARIGVKNALSNYEHYFGAPELSQADQQHILQLAEQKYSELQATRTMLGLGDFKNSTSKLVEVIEKR